MQQGPLIGVIRADGKGELRGEGIYRPVVAANADEVRALLMEHAISIAADQGAAVGLRVVDVDAVYPLVVGPRGEVAEAGMPEPKQPGDDELQPLKHEGYDPTLDAALRLPKPEMLSRTPDPEHLATREIPLRKRVTVDETVENDDDEIIDDFHDEGLDDSFDEDVEVLEDADAEAAAEIPAPDAAHDADEADTWTPSFPRGRTADEPVAAPAPAPEVPQPDAAPTPRRSPLGDAFTIPDEVPTPKRPQQARPAPAPAPAPASARSTAIVKRVSNAPTLNDFLAEQDHDSRFPAQYGWRAGLRRGTGGLIKLGPGKRERQEREELAAIRRSFDGSKTIVVVNPKGGAHKTTASLMIAAMFGMHRGGYTLAWDNNETRGTLGWRSQRGDNDNTAVDLLRQLPKLEVMGGATIGDIDRFVRNQGAWKFDVLASDDDAASAAIIDDEAFSRLHRTLSRFYRVLVVDTGNNMRASNWEAALDVADQLVIVSTHREDTAASAAWLADGLRERGHEAKLRNAVTILSSPSTKGDRKLTQRLTEHFEQLTRAVVEVPYDHEFVGGGQLDIDRLAPATRAAWRHAAAVIAEGL